ncbi:uncharacterized protein LOC126822735 [Patella vulgata]|uniref:uncharacterized protein LOC126822735 n=1 Tax=Patella vulgata TaxID=6465 RepID=UPI0024A996D8|nr:uncharacterized protein LOC126822735 [Patella vulgata]XP_055957242.1 uncharacterized protein LOC126822735 [Patella vulgata]
MRLATLNLVFLTIVITHAHTTFFRRPMLLSPFIARLQPQVRPSVPVVMPVARKVCSVQRVPIFIPVPFNVPSMPMRRPSMAMNKYIASMPKARRTSIPQIVTTNNDDDDDDESNVRLPVTVKIMKPSTPSTPTMARIRQMDDDSNEDDDEDDDDDDADADADDDTDAADDDAADEDDDNDNDNDDGERSAISNTNHDVTDNEDDNDDDMDDENGQIYIFKTRPKIPLQNVGILASPNMPGVVFGTSGQGATTSGHQEIDTDSESVMNSFPDDDNMLINVLRTPFSLPVNSNPTFGQVYNPDLYNPNLLNRDNGDGRATNTINTVGISQPFPFHGNNPTLGQVYNPDIYNPNLLNRENGERATNNINTIGASQPFPYRGNSFNEYEPQGESVYGPNIGDIGGESNIFNYGGMDFEFGQRNPDSASINPQTAVSGNVPDKITPLRLPPWNPAMGMTNIRPSVFSGMNAPESKGFDTASSFRNTVAAPAMGVTNILPSVFSGMNAPESKGFDTASSFRNTVAAPAMGVTNILPSVFSGMNAPESKGFDTASSFRNTVAAPVSNDNVPMMNILPSSLPKHVEHVPDFSPDVYNKINILPTSPRDTSTRNGSSTFRGTNVTAQSNTSIIQSGTSVDHPPTTVEPNVGETNAVPSISPNTDPNSIATFNTEIDNLLDKQMSLSDILIETNKEMVEGLTESGV